MKKLLISIALLMSFAFASYAGGLLTNTNQDVAFLRSIARDATTDIDAVYSNPAGVAFMKDGWHLSANIQSAYQTRTIHSTFPLFVENGGNVTKKYYGEATAPIVPSIQAAYKKGKWSVSGSFAVTGGGGKATFNDGLGSFESQIAMIPSLLTSNGITATKYSVDEYMQGAQFIYGAQVGGSYKINEHFSAYAGMRMNYVDDSYTGHIRDIEANVGTDGAMENLNKYFTTKATVAEYAAQQAAAAGETETAAKYEQKATQCTKYATLTADKEIECEQTGWGVTPILGVDFNWGKWNAAAKYEFRTALNVENKTKVDDTGNYKDGVNTPHDIPALLTLGLSYDVISPLKASIGFHYFFDKQANMANDKQKYLDRGTYELLAGLEWRINKYVLVSSGIQRTDYGVTDEYQTDMSFACDSYTWGAGAKFNLTSKLSVNVAYFMTIYDTYTKTMDNYGNTGIGGTDEFDRTNKVFGMGVDYDL